MSDEGWNEYLEEMKLYSKRMLTQSGGRLVIDPYPVSPETPNSLRDYRLSPAHTEPHTTSLRPTWLARILATLFHNGTSH
jgi:hypothetical protein